MRREYAIAVDVGATWLRVALGDEKGKLLAKLSQKTRQKGRSGETVTEQVLRMMSSLVKDIDLSSVKGVGIGSIGPIDLEEGSVVNSPNLPFEQIPLAKPISSELELPVWLLNDCAAAVLGEWKLGAGRGLENLVYVTLSTGIGGGAVVNNRLLIGKSGNAVEIGHLVVDVNGSLRCGCGGLGHWEAYCSGANLPNFIKLQLEEMGERAKDSLIFKLAGDDLTNLTAENLFDAAKAGDKVSLRIIEEIGKLNAAGFASVINVYDPSLVTVGGAIALENPELILEPVKKRVKELVIGELPRIEVTKLGRDITLYGGVAVVLHSEELGLSPCVG
jgi:glucokinase